MGLRYLIPAGEVPEEAQASLYQQQEDGSYLLQIDDLPAPLADGETKADTTPEASFAPTPETCHGAGVHHANATAPGPSSTVIASDDGNAISQAISALATGAVRLGK